MAKQYTTLNEAMVADDEMAEARIRYRLLAEAFEDLPQLRSQLNPQIERAKAEIARLKALAPKSAGQVVAHGGEIVAFNAARFRKSG